MKIKITRDGKEGKIKICVNDVKIAERGVKELSREWMWEATKILTGAEWWEASGVLYQNASRVRFRKGGYEKEFNFKKIDYFKDDLGEIAAELKRRIEMVRAWIDSLDCDEEKVEFEVEGEPSWREK